MPIRISIRHRTVYQYDRPVFLTTHLFRLKPAAHGPALVEDYTLNILPESNYRHWQQDVYGNFVARIDFKEKMHQLSAEVVLTVAIRPYNPFDFFIDEYAQQFPLQYPPSFIKALAPYLEIVDRGPKLLALAEAARAFAGETIHFLVQVNALIGREIKYTTRMEPGVQTSEQSLDKALGSCRDSAWLLVQVLRHLGLASRFVSGYLVQLSDSTTMFADSVDLHAWAEVFIPGAGWIGLDPTSGLLAGEGHLPLACTPHPEEAAPVQGTSDVCNATLTYESTVTRLSYRY